MMHTLRTRMSDGHDLGAVKSMSALRRVTGMGIAGSLALALLAGGCVLAATAGPREAQATGLLGVQQLMDRLPQTDKTIVASSSWQALNADIDATSPDAGATIFPASALENVTTQLRTDFGEGPLPLAPQSADWGGLASALYSVSSAPPALKGIPARLEIAYRYPLAGHLRLVAGSMPDTGPQPTTNGYPSTNLPVVVTSQMARAFALRPGSVVTLYGPDWSTVQESGNPSGPPPTGPVMLRLHVTGIVEPADPGSAFWKTDPLLTAPSLFVSQTKVWEGSVIADPGDSDVIQQIFGADGLSMQWDFPVDTTRMHAQAPSLFSQVNGITHQIPPLTGPLAGMAAALAVSSGLLQPLADLVQASNGVNALLWMIYVGLGMACVVMMLLAARMIAARRSAEMAIRRARGASLAQLFLRGSLGAAVACVPVAALAWALAVLLVPGAGPAGWVAWWPGIATLAVAVAGPGVVATWQHRLPRRRLAGRARGRWRRRWASRVTFEVTACAAAIGGITVLRMQAGGTDLYTSAAPLLVAVPAVIVVLRLYQLMLRGLARASARRRGVIGFLGLARAAQATATLALPAVTLVLALTMAAFTIMLRDAVAHGEIATSWQETGADVVVASPGIELGGTSSVISPSGVRAIAAVPGVQHAATALELPLTLTGGAQVTAIAVDPASYAALVESAEGFSPVNPALLTEANGQGAIPVLASPRAAAYLATQGASTIFAQQGITALRVRVSGELQSTPALPAGGAFMVMPLSAIHSASANYPAGEPPPVNLVLLTGPSIDMARIHAAVQAALPGAVPPIITTRSQALQQMTGAPLQQGTFLIFTLAIVCAAALALAVMLLELALSTRERELTMAKLATMGLAEGQRVRLAVLEVLPAIAASAVAAAACAIALPRLVAPAINLSAFTQSQAPVSLRPDFASFLLPLAVLLLITVIALAYEVRLGRGRVAVTMRA
jgi:putative ABC transport system permease protein